MTTGSDATPAGLPPAQGLYDPRLRRIVSKRQFVRTFVGFPAAQGVRYVLVPERQMPAHIATCQEALHRPVLVVLFRELVGELR